MSEPTRQELRALINEYFVAEREARTYQGTWGASIPDSYRAYERYDRVRCAMLTFVFGENDRFVYRLKQRIPHAGPGPYWEHIIQDLTTKQEENK